MDCLLKATLWGPSNFPHSWKTTTYFQLHKGAHTNTWYIIKPKKYIYMPKYIYFLKFHTRIFVIWARNSVPLEIQNEHWKWHDGILGHNKKHSWEKLRSPLFPATANGAKSSPVLPLRLRNRLTKKGEKQRCNLCQNFQDYPSVPTLEGNFVRNKIWRCVHECVQRFV
jgi:hypothetical protein